MKKAQAIEIHPEWYYEVKGMRTLILGTFPPYVRRYEFYYPNKANRFWKVLAELADEDPEKLELGDPVVFRKKLMRKLKVGVHNLGHKINRKGTSSLDDDIEILEYHDLKKIFHDNKELSRVIITGYSGRTNTLRGFLTYLKEHDLAQISFKECLEKKTFSFIFSEREITCFITNSPSPASQKSGVTFEKLKDQFKQGILFDRCS